MTFIPLAGWTIQRWQNAKKPGWFAVENLGQIDECCVGPLTKEEAQHVADEMNKLELL